MNPAAEDLPRPLRHLAALVAAPIVIAVAVIVGTLAVLGDGGSAARAGSAPLELASVPASIGGHYHAAEGLADVYRQVPCFCGCEEFLGHRDLYDCFTGDFTNT